MSDVAAVEDQIRRGLPQIGKDRLKGGPIWRGCQRQWRCASAPGNASAPACQTLSRGALAGASGSQLKDFRVSVALPIHLKLKYARNAVQFRELFGRRGIA